MDKIKAYVADNFEGITVLVVLLSIICINYVIDEKMMMLNFYYLPVLLAGYFMGKRASVLVAMFSVLTVLLFAVLNASAFSAGRGIGYLVSGLSGWSGFLLLTSYVIGTLYEQKQKRINELQRAYVGILEILVKYLESTDRYTKGHSERVALHAMDIAIAMGLSRQEVENIRVAALLHDIGKIEISADLIDKAASLSQEEMMQLAQHSEKGARILLSVGSVLKEAIPIVLEHHKYFAQMEKPADGAAKTSSLGTRIVAVADSFDAMTSDRPYRKGIQPWQALEELRRYSGEQFDPGVVKAFESVLTHKLETV
ncbi:MAG: HD domain-containing protein [Candidatus Hydrogenedentota bacterium]|nr:MAG: HD domain-containing protein [Candidatus Hydrogenedentota bacterium]